MDPEMPEEPDELEQTSLDYRTDGSWRINPPEVQAKFLIYISALGYRPNSLTPELLKALVEAFLIKQGFRKTGESEQILCHPEVF